MSKVLVATGIKGCPEATLRHAMALAGREGEVVLASVLVVPLAQTLDASLNRAVEAACDVLERGERVAASADHFDTRLVRARSFSAGVLETLEQEPFDIVVLEAPPASRRNGQQAELEAVMERAPATVVVVRPLPIRRSG
jgi:hypothetical protein